MGERIAGLARGPHDEQHDRGQRRDRDRCLAQRHRGPSRHRREDIRRDRRFPHRRRPIRQAKSTTPALAPARGHRASGATSPRHPLLRLPGRESTRILRLPLDFLGLAVQPNPRPRGASTWRAQPQHLQARTLAACRSTPSPTRICTRAGSAATGAPPSSTSRGRQAVAGALHRFRAPGGAVELRAVLLGRGRRRRQPLALHRRGAARGAEVLPHDPAGRRGAPRCVLQALHAGGVRHRRAAR